MRKVAAATLALPILASYYVRAFARGGRTARTAAALALAFLVVAAAIGSLGASRTTASAPERVDALAPYEFETEIRTDAAASAEITMTFPTAMDTTSVEAMLRVQPATSVSLEWDDTRTVLTVRPRGAWAPGTYHTITIEAGALEASGRPTATVTRAAFLTRPSTAASIEATDVVAGEALVGTAFVVSFERPVDEATLKVTLEPAVAGTLEPATEADVAPTSYRFVPFEALAPDTTYHVSLAAGLLDREGAPVAGTAIDVTTAGVPAVVRFRPRANTTGIARGQVLSVRFTESMDHATTEAAWTASVGGAAIAGSFSWAESDTVLVFRPKAIFAYGATVVMRVDTSALSQAGVALSRAASATFTTIPKPSVPSRPPSVSSGSVGAGAWAAVESFYLGLLNCTRQGGLVTSSGDCSSPGGSGLNALILDRGISDRVARPYAKLLATRGICSHYANGDPGDRLRAAGYTSAYWGENLGCRSGDPFKSVLASHLFFQSEAPYNGGHWRNIMRPVYTHVGIGVWVSSGRVRLVTDFYWPR